MIKKRKFAFQSMPGCLIVGSVLLAAIAAIDFVTTPELSLAILYLLPILWVAWCAARPYGFLFSFLCAIVWGVGDITSQSYSNSLFPIWNALVRLGFFLIISSLVSAQKLAYEREKQFARTDGLTGITNRRFFLELLEIEIHRSARFNHPFTLAIFDVDNFKQVNDRQGHPSGDRLLELIAKTVECEIRASDAIARLGGDEFVLLLPETDANPARATLQRIRQQLLEMVRRHDWPVSFSIGAVTFSAPPASASDAIAACDRLLYQVKNQGKNAIRHQTFSSDFPPNKENL